MAYATRQRGPLGVRQADGTFHPIELKDIIGPPGPMGPPGPVSKEDISPLLAGPSGREYRFLAGVIRNNNDGLGWQLVNDGLHPSIGITSVDSLTNTAYIRVRYPDLFPTGSGIPRTGSLLAVPDETLAQSGIFCGSSVAPDYCDIRLGRTGAMADYLSYNGSAWVWDRGAQSPFTVADSANNTLRITHPAVSAAEKHAIQLVRRGNGPIPVVSADTGYGNVSEFKVDWLDPTTNMKITTPNNTMRAAISRSHTGLPVLPADVNATSYPNSNIWIFGVHSRNYE